MITEYTSADFWNHRVNNFGHTGWADFTVYAFDQPARIKTIKQVLIKHNVTGSLAVDFGCGTGDFSNILCNFFNTVVGYDISEKVIKLAKEKYQENKKIRFFTGCSVHQLPLTDNSVDLFLCVTVLDHIKKDDELKDALAYFYNKMAPSGLLLALEYAPALEYKEKSEYQRFDLQQTWKDRFLQCGFKINKEYGFYHPQEAPSASYLKYISNTKRKFWHALGQFNFSKKKIADIAQSLVEEHDDFFYESTPKDLLRIMMLTKTEAHNFT